MVAVDCRAAVRQPERRQSQDYFSDGLTDDLLTNLARIPHLVVMSRTATAKYEGQAVDIPQIGRELGVLYMVEGSVQRAGDQMRIDAKLIETATDAQVWSEIYDRPTKEIFAAQDDITLAIAAKLSVQHTAPGSRAGQSETPTA